MEMGQMILNKDSNEVKRFIEVMEGISKMLDANSLIYRPILNGNRYITEQELSKALKITKRTLIVTILFSALTHIIHKPTFAA